MSHRTRRQAFQQQQQQQQQATTPAPAPVASTASYAGGPECSLDYLGGWSASRQFDFQQRLDYQRQLHEQTDLLRRIAPRF